MKKIKFEKYCTSKTSKCAIIAIHGWKGNRYSLKQIAISLNLKNAEWFFPEAPYIVDNNEKERSWSYEIKEGLWERNEPKKLMDEFINNQILVKYESKDVFFIGFSQGALMCYEYVLNTPYRWAGVIPIAGFMLDTENQKKRRLHPNQKNTPIIIGHGIQDQVVKLKSSELAYSYLKKNGANVKLITYSGNHKIGIQFLRRIRQFVESTTESN